MEQYKGTEPGVDSTQNILDQVFEIIYEHRAYQKVCDKDPHYYGKKGRKEAYELSQRTLERAEMILKSQRNLAAAWRMIGLTT